MGLLKFISKNGLSECFKASSRILSLALVVARFFSAFSIFVLSLSSTTFTTKLKTHSPMSLRRVQNTSAYSFISEAVLLLTFLAISSNEFLPYLHTPSTNAVYSLLFQLKP